MVTDELDALVFKMALESVRALPLSFAEKAAEIAARSRGVLLFDVRIDGDAEVQRIAAIRYTSDQMGILALDKQDSSTRQCMINDAFSSLIAPLETWAGLPLSTQATIDITGHVSLFVGALRNSGYLFRS
ncbi:hypothetical protein [Mesorhizobium sp. SP-1A]|uniref:hypothetical protein n=1 Tax=Mesorhizobium sp. SP-1A TaxID=3077840 RepID=UPI0028F70687|nr:hypothetical protein [Mesorhizobium sp. SP-1A]